MSHGHESASSSTTGEMVTFIFALFACFWEWLDEEVPEMLDKPSKSHH